MKYIIIRFSALNPDTLKRLGITHLLNAAEPGPGRCSTTSKTSSSTSVDLSEVDMTRLDYLGLQLADNRLQDISSYFR